MTPTVSAPVPSPLPVGVLPPHAASSRTAPTANTNRDGMNLLTIVPRSLVVRLTELITRDGGLSTLLAEIYPMARSEPGRHAPGRDMGLDLRQPLRARVIAGRRHHN